MPRNLMEILVGKKKRVSLWSARIVPSRYLERSQDQFDSLGWSDHRSIWKPQGNQKELLGGSLPFSKWLLHPWKLTWIPKMMLIDLYNFHLVGGPILHSYFIRIKSGSGVLGCPKKLGSKVGISGLLIYPIHSTSMLQLIYQPFIYQIPFWRIIPFGTPQTFNIPKIDIFKRSHLFQTTILSIHVSFRGGK